MQTVMTPAKASKASVLVALHEPVTRLGLVHLVNGHKALRVCAEAETAATAREQCDRHQPDAMILDPEMDGGGTSLLRDLSRWSPRTRLIVFTGTADALAVQRALAAGALGYITRRDLASDLLITVQRALEGRRHVGPQAEHFVLERLAHGKMELPGNAEAALSDREMQVFRLIGMGQTLREVAAKLHVSAKTIETHRHRIKLKLDVRSGVELQRRATLFCHGSHTVER